MDNGTWIISIIVGIPSSYLLFLGLKDLIFYGAHKYTGFYDEGGAVSMSLLIMVFILGGIASYLDNRDSTK